MSSAEESHLNGIFDYDVIITKVIPNIILMLY